MCRKKRVIIYNFSQKNLTLIIIHTLLTCNLLYFMINFNNLLQLVEKLRTEKECINYFIQARWSGIITCPFCNCKKVYNLKQSNEKFKCRHNKCYKIFSYKTGTIFENTKIPMRKWFIAIYLQGSHKKGISSHQLARDIGVTQKTAWFMLMRIREMMSISITEDKGTFEIDEAYLGGTDSNKHKDKKNTKEKTIVLGMINRDTKQVKAMKVPSNEKEWMLPKIYMNVKDKSTIMTDTLHTYSDLKRHYNHKTIKHSAKEYYREEKDNEGRTAFKIHTNTIEGYWGLLKRGITGIYHWASEKHIQRYVNEFSYRYNTKESEEGDRFIDLLQLTNNKRLRYKSLIS